MRLQDLSKSFIILFIILILLFSLNIYSFLFFHLTVEIASIVIGISVLLIVWNARIYNPHNPLIYFGITLLFTAIIDFAHTFPYKGMNIFMGNDANLPTQFWIAARYFQSISFAIIPVLDFKKGNYKIFTAFGAVITTFLIWAIFKGIFPDCYIEGKGLTIFKIYSEYLISFILFISIILLYKFKNKFNENVIIFLGLSIASTIFSELLFTFYIGVYDISNTFGHLFKFASFYLIYKAIVVTALNQPFETVFKEISNITEDLKYELELKVKNQIEKDKLIKKLNRSNNELEQFAYVASHDLQEPLRLITSYTQLLKRDYKDKLDDNANTYIGFAVDSAMRMKNLIADLLQYSIINASSHIYINTDLNKIIYNVSKILSEEIENNSAKIEYDKLPIIKCNPPLLTQLFQNLISNSIKFRSSENPIIKITHSENEEEHIINVIDNGIGINKMYADKIFVIFNRLHTIDKYEGTGIGLAIAKKIVEYHDGKITYEPNEDKGTTFTFTISKNLLQQIENN